MSNKIMKKVGACALSAVMAFGMFAATDLGSTKDVQAASKKKVKTIKFKKKGYVLSKKGKKINLAKRLTFSPKRVNTKKVTYKTSNKKIATVSSKGVVTAKKKGTVTITATSKSNKKAKATTRITVGKGVKTLKFKEGTARTVKEGYKFTLHPTYSPKSATTKSVTFKSSNTRVATVSSKGRVTVKAPGTAYITATCKDAYRKTATFKVTAPYVSSVSLNSASALEKGSTMTVSAKVAGTTSGVRYVWTTSNSNVLKITPNGSTAKVKAVAAGSATIKVEAYTYYNAKRRSASAYVSVGSIEATTGDNEFEGKDVIIPAKTTGTVNINNSDIRTLTLERGNYTVNLYKTKVRNVVVTGSAARTARAAANTPVLNIRDNSSIDDLSISSPVEVALASTTAEIEKVEMNIPTVITAVEGAKAIEEVSVNTAEAVTIQVPVDTLKVEAKTAVTVNSEVGTVEVNDTAKVELTASAVVDKIEVNAADKNGTVEIVAKDGAAVTEVIVSKDTGKVEVTGEGKVDTVVVPEEKKDDVNAETPGTVVEDENGDEIQTNPDFVKAESVTENGMTTFTVKADAAKYKVVKGNHTTFVTGTQVENGFNYLADPAKAYTKWMSTSSYTDYSGIVTVNGTGAEKTVVVKGTTNYDGSYKVKIEEVKAGTDYKVTVTDKDNKVHNIKVTVAEDGSVVAESAKYTATVNAAATEFALVRKSDDKTIAKATKANGNYELSLLEEKAADISIEYLAKAE